MTDTQILLRARANEFSHVHVEHHKTTYWQISGAVGINARVKPLLGVEVVAPQIFHRDSVSGKITTVVGTPLGAFRDFGHWADPLPDPAMVLVRASAAGLSTYDSSQPSGMRRLWLTASPARDYKTSNGYAWRRTAFTNVGLRVNAMPVGASQFVDGAQVEVAPLSQTGPSAYHPARALQVVVKPDRLNYAINGRGAAGTTNWSADPDQVVATNRYTDPAFVGGPSKWSMSGGTVAAGPEGGIKVTATGTGYALATNTSNPVMGLAGATKAYVSVDVRVTGTAYVAVQAAQVNASGAGLGNAYATLAPPPAGVWTRMMFVLPLVAGTDHTSNMQLMRSAGGVAGDTVEWRNLRVSTVSDASFFDGDTPAVSGYAYKWLGVPGASASEKYVPVPGAADQVVTTNLAPNPSAEVGLATLTSYGSGGSSATFTRFTSGFTLPPDAAVTSMFRVSFSTAPNSYSGFTESVSVVAGKTYVVAAWFRQNGGTAPLAIAIPAVTSGPNFTTVGAWQRQSLTFTATTTGSLPIGARLTGSDVAGTTFDVAGFVVAEGNVDPGYFNPSAPPSAGYSYRWTGPANASTSEKFQSSGSLSSVTTTTCPEATTAISHTWTTTSAAGHDGTYLTSPIPLLEGQHSFGILVSPSRAQSMYVTVDLRDASGAVLKTVSTVSAPQWVGVTPSNPWTRLSIEDVAVPAGVASVRIGAHALAPLSAGETLLATAVLVERASTLLGPYFDGASGPDYLWQAGGAAHTVPSFYYRDRGPRGYLLKQLLAENVPLGITPNEPQYAVLPTE